MVEKARSQATELAVILMISIASFERARAPIERPRYLKVSYILLRILEA